MDPSITKPQHHPGMADGHRPRRRPRPVTTAVAAALSLLADDLIDPDLNVFCDLEPGQRDAKTVRFDDVHSRAIYDVEMVVSRPSA